MFIKQNRNFCTGRLRCSYIIYRKSYFFEPIFIDSLLFLFYKFINLL